MRALLSAVGTRGDVQPLLALALEVRALGHDVRVCVSPNFVDWARSLGLDAVAVGIEMRAPKRGAPPPVIPDLIGDQFDAIGAAAGGCDVMLGANAHQYAARSIAERRGLPYVTALYAPILVAPPAEITKAWNARALERVNENRARLGLSAIDDVLRFNVTDAPWLATDAALAPAAPPTFQTGAWILEDETPLAPELADFVARGEPPIALGLGSMPAPEETGRTLALAARAVGRRAIVSRGWAELDVDDAPDCFAVGDVNQQALFPRVAAVVHHGGAGTTAAAARAGVPQVIAPMFGDQFFWAERVREAGIGSSVAGALGLDSLASALREALVGSVAERARAFAARLSNEGARVAARRLVELAR